MVEVGYPPKIKEKVIAYYLEGCGLLEKPTVLLKARR